MPSTIVATPTVAWKLCCTRVKACAVQARGTASTEDSTSVPVTMEMKAGAPQANEHVSAQQDKHHADDAFQRPRQVFTETQIQKDSRTGKDQQSQRMAQTPNRAMGGAVRRTDRVPVQSDDKAAT